MLTAVQHMHGGAQRTDQTKVYTKLVTIRSTLVVMTLIGMTSFFLMTASCKQPSSWQCMSPPDMLEQSFSDKVLGKSSQPWQQGFAVYAHITETTLSHQDIKMSYSLRVYNGKALLSLSLFALTNTPQWEDNVMMMETGQPQKKEWIGRMKHWLITDF